MAKTARTYRGTPRNLALLAGILREGGLVAVPTETVYGLAGDATSRSACLRIFAAKGRPSSDPLIVHIASLRDLARVAVPNPAALKLARRFWPGPLTIVLPKTGAVPDEATANLPSVAVRMPSHPLFRRLIRLSGVPLAAPSANPFGYVSPTTAGHVRDSLGGRVRHILDGGPSSIGLESTIVDLRDPRRPAILRPGAVTRREIARALGTPVAGFRRSGGGRGGHLAPGQMARHYSPRTPVVLHSRLDPRAAARGRTDAWLFVSRPPGAQPPNVFWLDSRGDLRRAARRLFAVLRELDEGGFRRIHAECPVGAGMAEALRDRLARASSDRP
jgi:L-threonylcarbamoyladenylate synthase